MMKPRRTTGKGEKGAALASVLVMVAVMSGLAIVVVDAARFSIQRTANQEQSDQTRWYLLGAEAYAASRIDQFINTLAMTPAQMAQIFDQPISLPLDNGAMEITVRDGGNCFNLNAVVAQTESGPLIASDAGRLRFARLAALLNIQNGLPLASSLADWIDTDASLSGVGVEDDIYGGSRAVFLPPNRLMGDVGEIRNVAGFQQSDIQRLAPYLCSRPMAAPNALNVNTLQRAQAALLASTFGAGLTLSSAEQVIAERPADGWTSVDAFLSDPRLASVEVSEETRSQFVLAPRWYIVGIRVQYLDASETSVVLIDTGGGHPRIVRRVFGADPQRALL